MSKLLVICGPTATGKTSLGLTLAKNFKGEIISADSRQVYKGMDIGTGKDLPKNSKLKTQNLKPPVGYYLFSGVRVWMLDVVEPNQEFSVAQYVVLSQKVMADIWQRNKLPILVGGTGFYIKGLIDGIETLRVGPDWELRMRLENLPAQNLFDLLSRIDPIKAASLNASDRKNPRRLIRAIEVANKQQTTNNKQQRIKSERGDTLFIGLKAPLKELYRKIDRRVEERVKLGIEKEIKKLISKGYSWNLPAMSALGYQEWQDYFEGQATREEVIQKWKFDEHGYARRQLTWFKKDKRINWFDINENSWKNKVEDLVKSWYNEKIKV